MDKEKSLSLWQRQRLQVAKVARGLIISCFGHSLSRGYRRSHRWPGIKPQPLLVTSLSVKSGKSRHWGALCLWIKTQSISLAKSTSMCSPLPNSSFPRLGSRQNQSSCLYTRRTPWFFCMSRIASASCGRGRRN